ncbi:Acrylyl-CoA reductase AcuI (plasmid) [Variovorax sp. SRS16]|uniref:acrylyl-CoA reductase (NADPH) n=1 Tax=Variovorax sp. SRS16 TaxID=282217 RepID=UPI0013179825|nr:MDR family oxidoreductase [Variovorax sp. SRS16]VTU46557.1 Acrylyl-CoA reductase AcuI [Variovorax sp. SRS16]
MFKAILLERDAERFDASVCEVDDSALPDFDVTLRVDYSSLNYKDALAIANRGPVVRKWPMVPGIDGAGVVEHSTHAEFSAGDRVILNGWGAGEQHWGCLAERARLQGEWLVPLPERLDARTAMALGTAGYTAMLCVQALERQRVRPDDGEILVTGAAGGVGSVAISLLAGRGFRVVASTGRAAEADYLKRIGAAEVIDRAQLSAPGKPLGKERWAGVVDSVGSHTLVNACATTKYGGVVTACGLAQGMDLPGTVAPFILRGVSLIGIDSVMAPRADRLNAWQRLSQELDHERLAAITHEIPLAATLDAAAALLAGGVRGRTVVNVRV